MSEQAQSYYSVQLRRKMTAYEMRLYLQIVRRAKALLYSADNLRHWLKAKPNTRCLNLDFAIPIKDIVGRTNNYSKLYNALKQINSLSVEHYDKATRTWRYASFMENIEVRGKEGVIAWTTPKWVMDYITDFAQNGGFVTYDYEHAMSLRNPFAARLYLLLSSQKTKVRYNYPLLKKVLGLDGKYKRFNDFEKRVLEPAKKELEERGYNGFEYEAVRKYGKSKTEVLAIDFRPIIREKARTVKEMADEIRQNLSDELISYFAFNLGFTSNELKGKNAVTIKAFTALDGWHERLTDIVTRARKKARNHGYIVNAMKKEIEEDKTTKPSNK